MYNKVIMMGRIVNDLELRSTPAGASVLSFRIAVDRRFQTKGEDRKSDFFNVVAWRNEAEFISRYFAKGRMILIEGELQTDLTRIRTAIQLTLPRSSLTVPRSQAKRQTTHRVHLLLIRATPVMPLKTLLPNILHRLQTQRPQCRRVTIRISP